MPSFLKNNIVAVLVGLLSLTVAAVGAWLYPNLPEYWQGIAVELGGSFWDVLLVVVLLGAYETVRRKKDKVAELRRRIDDFKKLDSDYGHAIIGSSLRELAELGVTKIDFRGIKISNFRFLIDHGIKSLKGSVFGDYLYFDQYTRWGSDLKNVSFEDVDCREVSFGKGDLSMCVLEDCSFRGANLQGVSFTGIRITYDKDKVKRNEDDWQELIDETEEGEPIYCQTYIPAFSGADLKGANFDKTRLENIDFREATNILDASFVGAQGIETCLFDQGVKEKLRTT